MIAQKCMLQRPTQRLTCKAGRKQSAPSAQLFACPTIGLLTIYLNAKNIKHCGFSVAHLCDKLLGTKLFLAEGSARRGLLWRGAAKLLHSAVGSDRSTFSCAGALVVSPSRSVSVSSSLMTTQVEARQACYQTKDVGTRTATARTKASSCRKFGPVMRLGAGEARPPSCQHSHSEGLPYTIHQGSIRRLTLHCLLSSCKVTIYSLGISKPSGPQKHASSVTCAGGVGTSFLGAFFAFFGLRATLSPQITATLPRAAAPSRLVLLMKPEKHCLAGPWPQWSMLGLQPALHIRAVDTDDTPLLMQDEPDRMDAATSQPRGLLASSPGLCLNTFSDEPVLGAF